MLISLPYLIDKYKMNITGIIHCGANHCEEMPIYRTNKIERVYWIEALPSVQEKHSEILKDYPQAKTSQACLSNVIGQMVKFNVANNGGQSSSLLDFGTHSKHHPSVIFEDTIELPTTTLDALFVYETHNCNMLVMDIQGAEYVALQGAKHTIEQMDYIYLEVNKEEVYKGCGLVTDIDILLARYGFERVETKWTDANWGDALYIKK